MYKKISQLNMVQYDNMNNPRHCLDFRDQLGAVALVKHVTVKKIVVNVTFVR